MITNSFAISENFNYLFTPKGVIKIFDDNKNRKYKSIIPYTMDNIGVAFDILKENLEFKYKTKKIDLNEYSNYPRKLLKEILNIIKPNNRLSIIVEWELKIGKKLNLINESVDRLLVERRINNSIDEVKLIVEQWYNPATWVNSAADYVYKTGSQIADKGIWGTISQGIASAWKCVTSGIECIMEGLRSITLGNLVGGVALAGISMIPYVGQIANTIIVGSILIWDLYKMLSGQYESGQYAWSWVDIIIDIISLIPGAGGAIVRGVRTALSGVKTLAQIVKLAAKGGIIGKVVNLIRTGVNAVMGIVGQSAKFIAEKLGAKGLASWATKSINKLKSIFDDLGKAKVPNTPATQPTTAAVQPTFKAGTRGTGGVGRTNVTQANAQTSNYTTAGGTRSTGTNVTQPKPNVDTSDFSRIVTPDGKNLLARSSTDGTGLKPGDVIGTTKSKIPSQPTTPKTTGGGLTSLSTAERNEYNKLLANWETQQKNLGKTNLDPGQGTRNSLIKQAKAKAKDTSDHVQIVNRT